jgi:hypothetical protein
MGFDYKIAYIMRHYFLPLCNTLNTLSSMGKIPYASMKTASFANSWDTPFHSRGFFILLMGKVKSVRVLDGKFEMFVE